MFRAIFVMYFVVICIIGFVLNTYKDSFPSVL